MGSKIPGELMTTGEQGHRSRRLRHRQEDWADHPRMPAEAGPRERNAGPQ